MLNLRPVVTQFFFLFLFSVAGCGHSDRPAVAKANQSIQATLEAIRTTGAPISLTELDAWYVTRLPSENGAQLYIEAFSTLVWADPKLPAFLLKNRKTLELLHQGGMRTRCRYPVNLSDGPNALLPHLAKLKTCSELLSAEAESQAKNDRTDLATQALVDGIHLARSLDDEPLLISQLVKIAAIYFTMNGFETALNHKAFTDQQLQRLQSEVHDAERAGGLTRALAGERVNGIVFFQSSVTEQTKWIKMITQSDDTWKDFDIARYRTSSVFLADFAFFLDYSAKANTASALPFPDALAESSKLLDGLDEAKNKGYQLSGIFLTPTLKPLVKVAKITARLRVAEAVLAVERYRLAHEKTIPTSLIQLVPAFLTEVPKDPFDDQMLRYKRSSPNAFVVYSIGEDKKDDGGKTRPPGATGEGSYDVTFPVRH